MAIATPVAMCNNGRRPQLLDVILGYYRLCKKLYDVGVRIQRGVPANVASGVKQFLDFHYTDWWIGRSGLVLWPPRSPDLTSTDIYLWS